MFLAKSRRDLIVTDSSGVKCGSAQEDAHSHLEEGTLGLSAE
jgi:hypothetical protein